MQGVKGNEEAEKELLPQMIEVKAMAERLDAISISMENILFGVSNDAVRWVEIMEAKENRPSRVTLHLSVECGDHIKRDTLQELQDCRHDICNTQRKGKV